MITTREEFRALAGEYRAIPVHRQLLADLTTPLAAFMRCVGDESGFCLESVENGERWSQFSFVGRRPHATLVARGSTVEVTGDLPDDDLPLNKGILAPLEVLLERYRAPGIPDLPPLVAGMVGYLGYDVIREIENIPASTIDVDGYPDAIIDVIGELAVFDHWRQRVTLVAVALLGPSPSEEEIDAAYDDAVERLEDLARAGARPIDEPLVIPPDESDETQAADIEALSITESLSGELYGKAVQAAKEYIRAGDIFQVVLSKRFGFDLGAEPIDVYRVLRQINPSPYMYFIRRPELTLVGCSPEPLVQVQGGRVISRPIAGTRRRGRTEQHDRLMAAELAEDPKEQAEHVMLVDLARNDVGRVVEFGSLNVDEMMTLERYSHVMHLTSQVSGDLAEGRSIIDVLRATLPAGTVSGAPKVRAMEIIDELEPVKRGPYSGVVGYLSFSGNLDTAIAIRTMVCGPDTASVQAGAGVVADSVPELENKECWNKARALLAAVGPARRMRSERAAGILDGEAAVSNAEPDLNRAADKALDEES
ncbi:MAG: chorismate-binding protein [Acidimicrobiia bacterium]|nr:chorismate-binding protein [Acidimicrobiia bacterium]